MHIHIHCCGPSRVPVILCSCIYVYIYAIPVYFSLQVKINQMVELHFLCEFLELARSRQLEKLRLEKNPNSVRHGNGYHLDLTLN
jgi:hypothetical protein